LDMWGNECVCVCHGMPLRLCVYARVYVCISWKCGELSVDCFCEK